MNSVNNVKHVFVIKEVATQVKTSGVISSYADIAYDGEMAFVDEKNEAVSDISTLSKFRIVQRSGTKLLVSPYIKRTSVFNSRTTSDVVATQQVTYIGYNGSSGQISAVNSNDYIINLWMKSRTTQFGDKRMLKHGIYRSDATATTTEVAFGLAGNLVANMKRDPNKLIQIDVVNNATVTTGNGWASNHNATVVKGLDTITVGTNCQYATSTELAVNDLVRIGSVGGGTTLTSSVYKVIKLVSGTVFQVDRPVEQASGTYAGSTNDMEVIPYASIGDYGIKLTGLSQVSYFVPGQFEDYLVEFTAELVNFSAADTVTYSTAANPGKGTYSQVATLEWMHQSAWGKSLRLGIPPPTAIANAVAGTAYDIISFQYRNSEGTSILGVNPDSVGEIIIACAVASGTTHTQPNAVLDVLRADTTYFPSGTCPNFS